MQIETIVVVILTLMLWRAYHTMFRVVYTNPLVGFIREIVICLLISVFIVYTVANKLNLQVFEKETDTGQSNAISQTDDTKGIGGLFQHSKQTEERKKGYMGVFHNHKVGTTAPYSLSRAVSVEPPPRTGLTPLDVSGSPFVYHLESVVL